MSESYTYTIQSVQTGYYIISASDNKFSQSIATVDGNGGVPAGATLTFNKALEPGNNIDVTIKSINGLYAGWGNNMPYPPPLAWSKDAVNWQVEMTSPGVYVIIPKGQDLYWYTNKTMNRVTLMAGKNVVENENKWYIKKGKDCTIKTIYGLVNDTGHIGARYSYMLVLLEGSCDAKGALDELNFNSHKEQSKQRTNDEPFLIAVNGQSNIEEKPLRKLQNNEELTENSTRNPSTLCFPL
ncbi:hypothetical protein F5146DRAFT_1189530 [Armillaria mellea]|nr:hypothetical protein F5146DRAFT_1189530 [Armillaria mellea]